MSSLGILLQRGLPAQVVGRANGSRPVGVIGNLNFSGAQYEVHAPGAMGSLFKPQVLEAPGSRPVYVVRPFGQADASIMAESGFIPEVNPFAIPFEKLEGAMNSIPLQDGVGVQLESIVSRPGETNTSLTLPFGKRSDDSPRIAVLRVQIQRGLWAITLKSLSGRTHNPENLAKMLGEQWVLIRDQADKWLADIKSNPNDVLAQSKLTLIRVRLAELAKTGASSPHFHEWVRDVDNFAATTSSGQSEYGLTTSKLISSQNTKDKVRAPGVLNNNPVPKADPIPDRHSVGIRDDKSDQIGDDIPNDQESIGEPTDQKGHVNEGDNLIEMSDSCKPRKGGSCTSNLEDLNEQIRDTDKKIETIDERISRVRELIRDGEATVERMKELLIRRQDLERVIKKDEQTASTTTKTQNVRSMLERIDRFKGRLRNVNREIARIEHERGEGKNIQDIINEHKDLIASRRRRVNRLIQEKLKLVQQRRDLAIRRNLSGRRGDHKMIGTTGSD